MYTGPLSSKLSVTAQSKCQPKLLSQGHTQAEVRLIATTMRLDSQPFHPACEMALKVLTTRGESHAPGKVFMAETDTHSWSAWKLLCKLELFSAADRKNSQSPRKGSNGYLYFTDLGQSKTNVLEHCESCTSFFILP